MFKEENIKYKDFNLKVFKSDSLNGTKLTHFFTTRVGGDTPKPLDTFTISAKDFLEYENFAQKNQNIICEILGSKNLLMPNQQHTDKILVIKNQEDIEKLKEEPFDAVITNLKNMPVGLVFADCVPVLLFDAEKNILACTHAGWKGTAKNIVQKTAKTMEANFNTRICDIKAVIGPAICQKCFEVNADVADKLAMSLKKDYGNIFIEMGEKIHADLKLINKYQLNEVGVKDVDVCEFCTSCNNDLFYSYRADNRCTGRHAMIAMIEE